MGKTVKISKKKLKEYILKLVLEQLGLEEPQEDPGGLSPGTKAPPMPF
jgi:hypothetical protein